MQKFDWIVIGFGKGGKTLAGFAAAQGKTVALIEQSKMMYGGTCINVGCIPSKTLVTDGMQSAQGDKTFAQKAALYTAAIDRKRQLTAALRQKNYHKLDALDNVTILDGKASFADDHHVLVNGEKIYGEMICINTGAVPVLPPIPGVKDNDKVFVSETLMDLPMLPHKLAIIGGGYIGLEFASMYTNFGSHVEVFQNGDTLIPREEREIADAVRTVMEGKGVTFHLGVSVERLEDGTVIYQEDGKEQVFDADAILIATGRKPNTEGLHLERAGVKINDRGAVVVDDNRRTSVPHIWAVGDVVGGLQFTYVSLDDFRIVKSALTGGTYSAKDRKNIPYSVFMDPTLSRIGLTEQEAKEQGYDVKVGRLLPAAHPKAHVLQRPQGLMKAVVDAKTHAILGVSLFCVDAHEMINLVKLAMDAGLPYEVLRDQIFTHPTMSEAFNDLFEL